MDHKIITTALYAAYLTNWYGLLLSRTKDKDEIMRLRLEYAKILFARLNISVKVLNKEKIPTEGQYLLISNHRSIIDPVVIDLAFEESSIAGYWVAKKELYNSLFFGLFIRNAGTVLLDRESDNMAGFFSRVKKVVNDEGSIYIFPEGTRNKGSAPISEFKEGPRIIAIKNRLPMLPVYIKTNASEVLKEAIKKRSQKLEIEFEIGDLIDYKSKLPLHESYKNAFNLRN
ncbi:MAG: 1-acyl-sn-glycerol-3-phosphate acyltransferase [Moraxellaceae bacterium]|nr:MAG: 1-acyl-sn-glycerol-3-phosphate acyltransferase [Moraxellaceae bacterium]